MPCGLIKDNGGSGGAENMLGHQARTEPLLHAEIREKLRENKTNQKVTKLCQRCLLSSSKKRGRESKSEQLLTYRAVCTHGKGNRHTLLTLQPQDQQYGFKSCYVCKIVKLHTCAHTHTQHTHTHAHTHVHAYKTHT